MMTPLRSGAYGNRGRERYIIMKILFALFFIAHGLVHASYLTPKPDDPKYPFSFEKSWFANLIGSSAKPVGLLLAIITVLSFVVAGLSILGFPGTIGS